MANVGDLFSIVCVGSMNPAIHHPSWYRLVGIISEEEAQLAIGDVNLIAAPQLARFSFGAIAVFCTPQRWHVQTTEEALVPRLVEVAKKTYQKLDQTPMGVLGINFDYCRPAGVPDVASLLSSKVHGLDVGIGDDPLAAATVSFVRRRDSHLANVTTTVVIAPGSVDPATVEVKNNIELRIKPEVGYYDAGELLADEVPAAQHQSLAQRERTLAALRATGRA